MAKRLFFSQSMLDSMAEAGRIKVDGNIMTVLAGDNPSFALLPAYRFVRTIDNAPDAAGLVTQIRSETELKTMGAEIYLDSVIYREVAYQADPGFIAEQQVPKPAEPASQPPAEAAKDEDALSKLILDTLL